ncbi:JAB domain-containing protein [Qipengyuania sediminis]|uniref:JAB domain-containing protein n=1 Tax=Qipengyuania sediminis TaxID=1532023 RepID=UPI00140549E4|nr:JAB domain-containing protein [Qipengyuania sediminis]
MAVATRLIETYGSPARALAASRESLESALPTRTDLADAITAARELASFGAAEELKGNILNPVEPRFLEFLRKTLGFNTDEGLYGVFLDSENRYIAAEWLAFGTRSQVDLACRALVGRILDLGARSLVLAHNHPSGDPTPSVSDRATTSRLQTVLEALDCTILDHLIVCSSGCYSMARAGDL